MIGHSSFCGPLGVLLALILFPDTVIHGSSFCCCAQLDCSCVCVCSKLWGHVYCVIKIWGWAYGGHGSVTYAPNNGSYAPFCIPGADVGESRGICHQNSSPRGWYLLIVGIAPILRGKQWRSQAGAHRGTYPSNRRPCPTECRRACKLSTTKVPLSTAIGC